MKFLILPFTFLMFLSSPTYAEDNELLHFGLSAGFGYVAENVIHTKVNNDNQRIVYGTLLGSVPGLVKEIVDDEFSETDMAFNIAGSLVGALIATRLNRNLVANIQKQENGYMLGLVYTD